MNENNAAQAAQKDWDAAVSAANLAPTTGHVVLNAATVLNIAALLSKLRAPVANETALQAWADRFPEISDMGRLRDAWNEARASAPVAGEVQQPVAHWIPSAKTFSTARVSPGKAWEPLYAAPQASAESTHKPVMSVAEFCAEAGRLGLTADTLAAQLSQRPEFADCLPQADKDGGQQRAGDECKHARAYRAGDRQGYACPDCGEFVSDYEIHRRQRAALSAPQAEQGERDA